MFEKINLTAKTVSYFNPTLTGASCGSTDGGATDCGGTLGGGTENGAIEGGSVSYGSRCGFSRDGGPPGRSMGASVNVFEKGFVVLFRERSGSREGVGTGLGDLRDCRSLRFVRVVVADSSRTDGSSMIVLTS